MSNLNLGVLEDGLSFSAIANTRNTTTGATDSNLFNDSTGLQNLTGSRNLSRSSDSGQGLQAQYYEGQDLTNLKLTRIDSTVDFDWASSSPDASLEPEHFSVRWTGQIQPKYSENYTFYTYSDDGVRLWVDGQLLIDHWTDHAPTEDSGTIALAAGQKYDIKLEYYENTVGAVSKLLWSSGSQTKEIVPQNQLYAPAADRESTPAPAASSSFDGITTTVDWANVEGSTTGLGFGLNAFQGFRPESFNSAAYKSNMSLMKPGLIRFHNATAMQDSSTPDGLIDTAHRTWDTTKIKQALESSFSSFDASKPERMINIPTWPSWMDANNDGFLDVNQFDNYAQLCADLVKIVNQDSNFKVKYWEVTNEKDDSYFTPFHTESGWGGLKNPAQPDRLNELIEIYNKAAVAMKQADPTIQVGGPGMARSDLQPFYVPFIQGTKANLDFFTYHHYATGSASTADSEIYDGAMAIGSRTASIVQALKEASPTREIPVMLGEYNISWTWQTRDPRMTTHKGVVFDALAMVSAQKNGAVAALAWNEKDGTYGKMGDQNDLRLGGAFLQVLNNRLVGEQVASSSNNEKAVMTFAVKNSALGYKSYLLINHSGTTQAVQADVSVSNPGTQIEQYEFSEAGSIQKTVSWDAIRGGMTLPADSVTLLTFAD
ncbi:MAG: hypothetical protein KME13_04110 [Myxacorys californica WJT36-NPBG1]|jgi:xylan 1,4-beta-xylosidase|nr:hypothetical protein [Myxacorys californica WJT36-NPBG1]